MQAVIFDMDGTLFQTESILESSLDDTFTYLRSKGLWEEECPTPIDTYRNIMGVPLPVVWETLLPESTEIVRIDANKIFHEKLIVNIKKGNGALYPHVEKALATLKQQNLDIYIASNGQIPYLAAIVEHYHLDRWVKETWSIEQVESLSKTDMVKQIMMKHGITTGAVVGDRLSDIIAAKENGLLAIGCRFDFAQDDELVQADVVIDKMEELEGVLIDRYTYLGH
ncbi:Phosphoglycolate phosphatase [Sutcliffiella rhizosphaerae]|uniref:Phosphoglycolate phosphatase n=2 Tax=Sutcliffiella rhizosphaerae TaxID=2880967 RepID=A0ABN8A8W8_9BACI|nr:Phosphoglycolate phosphatase [Sutcliffiella rhizosphaerae]